MQEVTCFHCRNSVHISPDAERCPVCGENLRHLMSAEQISGYFYNRSSAMAAGGDLVNALDEAGRGLRYRKSAELHLLAAILAQQVGRYDLMRQHVASIPVDDSLRAEAEWLLRAHQERQRMLREGDQVDGNVRRGAISSSYAAPDLDEILGRKERGQIAPASTRMQVVGFWSMLVGGLLFIVVLSVWLFLHPENGVSAWIRDRLPQSVDAATVPAQPDLQRAQDGANIGAGTDETKRDDAWLLPTPTPEAPGNLVQNPEGTALADSSARRVVVISSTIIELEDPLREAGHPELAALGVNGRLQDGTLTLQGIVNTDAQRRKLLDIARAIPGVSEVNSVGLLLRPMPNYVVVEGDTLWQVVYNIYGNVERLDEFVAYNADVLPSPNALAVGMVLKVPPVE
jgi:hypothetical protein